MSFPPLKFVNWSLTSSWTVLIVDLQWLQLYLLFIWRLPIAITIRCLELYYSWCNAFLWTYQFRACDHSALQFPLDFRTCFYSFEFRLSSNALCHIPWPCTPALHQVLTNTAVTTIIIELDLRCTCCVKGCRIIIEPNFQEIRNFCRHEFSSGIRLFSSYLCKKSAEDRADVALSSM